MARKFDIVDGNSPVLHKYMALRHAFYQLFIRMRVDMTSYQFVVTIVQILQGIYHDESPVSDDDARKFKGFRIFGANIFSAGRCLITRDELLKITSNMDNIDVCATWLQNHSKYIGETYYSIPSECFAEKQASPVTTHEMCVAILKAFIHMLCLEHFILRLSEDCGFWDMLNLQITFDSKKGE